MASVLLADRLFSNFLELLLLMIRSILRLSHWDGSFADRLSPIDRTAGRPNRFYFYFLVRAAAVEIIAYQYIDSTLPGRKNLILKSTTINN